MAEKFTRYDTAEYLKADADMAEYLDAHARKKLGTTLHLSPTHWA